MEMEMEWNAEQEESSNHKITKQIKKEIEENNNRQSFLPTYEKYDAANSVTESEDKSDYLDATCCAKQIRTIHCIGILVF